MAAVLKSGWEGPPVSVIGSLAVADDSAKHVPVVQLPLTRTAPTGELLEIADSGMPPPIRACIGANQVDALTYTDATIAKVLWMITVDLKRKEAQRIIAVLHELPDRTVTDKNIIRTLLNALETQPTPEQAVAHYRVWKREHGL
jgi:hypothetical protein